MKKNILGLIIMLVGVFGVAMPASAVTCQSGTIRAGATVSSYAECNLDSTQSAGTMWKTVGTGFNLVIGIIGIVAAGVIIYGGFQYMTSAGDASKLAKAKNTIMYGIIGMAIAVLAFAIVNFVVSNLLQ